MRWLKAVFIFVWLATWLSSSNHCYLEIAGILPPDECQTTETSSSARGDPCETGCKLVEEAGYKNQDNRVPAFVIALLPVIFAAELEREILPNPFAAFTDWPAATLNLPQFLARTSHSARAPSLVS